MASTYNVFCDAFHIVLHIIEEDRKCEQDRNGYHYAALIIQKNYRGYLARKAIRKLHEAATIMQKYIRGFLVRNNMGQYMLDFLQYRSMNFYHKNATKIQALWRGYQFRKNVLDFRQIYADKVRITKVNDELKERMKREKMKTAMFYKQKTENEAKAMILFILFKLHHLLRTQREGIYSLHGSKDYSWIEQLLKSIKFTSYMKALRKLYNKTYHKPLEREYVLKGRWKQCEEAYYKRNKENDSRPPSSPHLNEYLHPKRFCFDPRVEQKDEVPLLTRGKFQAAIKNIVRDLDKSLNIFHEDFDVTARVAELFEIIPPYYIDFWSRTCEIHNLPDLLQ